MILHVVAHEPPQGGAYWSPMGLKISGRNEEEGGSGKTSETSASASPAFCEQPGVNVNSLKLLLFEKRSKSSGMMLCRQRMKEDD